MMRVLLVDDEPFILEGLSVIVDWKEEDCEIVKKASNGKEALNYLKENTVDLVITDIKMPEMTGVELLEQIRVNQLSDAYFIVLSGYNDFAYAQKAIRYHCMDYLLKPVQKEALVELVRKARQELRKTEQSAEDKRWMQEAYLKQSFYALLRGKQEEEQVVFVKEHLKLGEGELRYVHICPEDISNLEEFSDDELGVIRRKIFEGVCKFLKEDAQEHCIRDASEYEEAYEIGFLYCEYMAKERGLSMQQFFETLTNEIEEHLGFSVILLVGKAVEDIERISRSYSTACVLRSFHGFHTKKRIYYYEDEVQLNASKVVLCKQSLDKLIDAVEQNDTAGINSGVDELFQEMESMGMDKGLFDMNTNYLLFQLIHLAVEQDETVNQEEVMSYISENVSDSGLTRGSRAHLRKFSNEYAEYLIQLRKNVSRGVLTDIEKEIKENYAENLTLRDLSKKYYVNSSYLGQIFRKKYGQSFKDYLCSYRINEAAQQLLKTDKKISLIAEEVGYRDTDYFISKFIEQKGCTPSKYRKNSCGGGETA